MKYYVIINGNSSLDIQGLAIESLPNISKPLIRTTREEIDGRDGDIITKLGYSAYDKTLNIGLWGNYDINEVIAFFNEEGVITFSNEPDKYYKFHILNRIDFVNQLEKFKKASITIHCQPFKYKEQEAKVIEEEAHTTSGTSFNLSDTIEATLEIDLKGNTSQTGTPTPTSPVAVNVVSGDNDITICSDNLIIPAYLEKGDIDTSTGQNYTYSNVATIRINNYIAVESSSNVSSYYVGENVSSYQIVIFEYDENKNYLGFSYSNTNKYVKQVGNTTKFIRVRFKMLAASTTSDLTATLIRSNQQLNDNIAYSGTLYPINLPVENLLNITNKTETISDVVCKYQDGTITLNGTCSSNGFFVLNLNTSLPSGDYSLSANNETTTSADTIIRLDSNNTGFQVRLNNANASYSGTYNATISTLTIRLNNGTQYSNFTFKPQLEKGLNVNSYTPYGITPIELCKIPNTNYEDRIFHAKDGDTYYDSLDSATKQTLTYGKWYLHKEIGKVDIYKDTNYQNIYKSGYTTKYLWSNNGIPNIKHNTAGTMNVAFCNYFTYASHTDLYNGTVAIGFSNGSDGVYFAYNNCSADDMKTFIANHQVLMYYLLETPTNTEITYTPLIEQLDALEEAQSYEGTTNINQVNNDLPFIIDLTYYTGDTSITITNDGNIYSKPLLELKGTGNINIYLNGIQVFVVSLNNEIIYIDTDKMEAYYQGTLKNRQVVGDYNNFKLQSGNNTIQVDGGYVEYLKITNYSRWV